MAGTGQNICVQWVRWAEADNFVLFLGTTILHQIFVVKVCDFWQIRGKLWEQAGAKLCLLANLVSMVDNSMQLVETLNKLNPWTNWTPEVIEPFK